MICSCAKVSRCLMQNRCLLFSCERKRKEKEEEEWRQKCNESKENGRIEGVFSVANYRTWMNDKEL